MKDRSVMDTGVLQVSAFVAFTIAILLLFVGKLATMRIALLRQYSIPEPVVGGFCCAVVVALAYYVLDIRIQFALGVRELLLLYFFAGIGLKSDMRTLKRGGWPLVLLLILASVFIVIQNLAGMGLAAMFGLDPRAGLMVGSISLTGGIGTTLAWSPIFIEKLGIPNAMELGIAGNTVGMIAACVVGGPVATWLIRHHGVKPSGNRQLDVGAVNQGRAEPLDYFSVLWALFLLNCALLIGWSLDAALKGLGLTLPTFVSCLMAGILIRNIPALTIRRDPTRSMPGTTKALALLGDVTLGLFLTMALMGLQLWELEGVFLFIIVVMVVQIFLTVMYALFVVFRLMGRDYEAAVMSAGFGGITLGSTATAIANMTAVAQQYGAAHRAFIVVPLVCGFFIDLVNAMIITALL
ncbi:sodium/glutamate symporter [Kerstersia similis]|uniref:sodium/glutamate symporter n=1 Tax=Kerstersia similis TaxID=206505 RepID=UPI0039EDEEDE